MEQHFEYNYYLYDCNVNRDIENNVGEVKPPDFTMEHIVTINEKYKKIYIYVTDVAHRNRNNRFNIQGINKINIDFNEFELIELELNELFMEHRHNIEMLMINTNEYNTIHRRLVSKNNLTIEEKVKECMFIKSKQIQMYFEDIVPIIKKDEENLNMVKALLDNMISAHFSI